MVWCIEVSTKLDAGIAVFLTFPPLISAMLEGQKHAIVCANNPTPQQCWKASCEMALCIAGLILAAAFVLWLLRLGDVGLTLLWPSSLILVCAFACVPLLRFGYGVGLRSVLKGQSEPGT